MKQLAVDFLLEELYKLTALSDFLDEADFIKARKMIFNKAKSMEKEQIIEAVLSNYYIGGATEEEAEQYYNETFKSE